MRQTIGRCVLCVALGAFVATAAMAQPGGGGRGQGGPGGGPGGQGGMGMRMGAGPAMGGGGGGLGGLVADEEIRSQLGLSEEQVAKFQALRDEMRDAPRPNITPPGPDASNEDRLRFRSEIEARMTEQRTKWEAVFTPDQLKKAQVIAFQATGGLNGPMRVELLAPLNLTAEQKAEIKKITDAADQERMEMFRGMRGPGAGGSPEEMRQRMENFGRQMTEKVSAVLTPEQKATATRLTTEGAALRERLQQRGPGGAQGNRGGRQQQGGGYRPDANSWQPGQGAPEAAPRRGFPRSNNAPQN